FRIKRPMKKPKLLLDENIGHEVISRLREERYDVASVMEDSPGVGDVKILERAKEEGRIVITLDQDFGIIVFRDSNENVGVLLLRLKKESAENIFYVIKNVLDHYSDQLERKFVVASESYIRIR
ncbi:MAG: DUF5615 family PIN-like protein, partial [Ignavibacteria bacterium]|nr:DUF5615 family PIN-like protein [Ignavibacteria bacterium]